MNLLKNKNFKFQIKNKNNKLYIFCLIRKKFYILNYEEWVRQNILFLLINKKGYCQSSIDVESFISFKGFNKRLDIIIYNKKLPYIIVECKSPYIKINQKIIDQLLLYNAIVYSKYIVVTNGLVTISYEIDYISKTIKTIKNIF